MWRRYCKKGAGGDNFSLAWKLPGEFSYELFEYALLCLFDTPSNLGLLGDFDVAPLHGVVPFSADFDAGSSIDLKGAIVSYA